MSLLLLLVGLAHAQVNAEPLRPDPLREGVSGTLDASLALYRGNVELFDLGGGGSVQYQTLHPTAPAEEALPEGASPPTPPLPFVAQRLFLTASGRFAERGGAPIVSQAFAHARWTAMWHERVGSDLFAQAQFNEFQRLLLRAVAGVGVRVEIVHEPVFMGWAGTGYMFEHDRLTALAGATDPLESFEHRWTTYLSMRLSVLEGHLLAQNTVYVQPRFDAFEDVRVLEELEVLSRLAEQFLFGATLSVLYDAAPPTAVQPVDLRLTSMLRVRL